MSNCRVAAALAVALALAVGAGTARADKPSWAGRQHHEDRGPGGRAEGARDSEKRLGEREARIVRDYFGTRFEGGHCPPGLAKKRNGCMPPGQAKKWARGRPLPPGVVYYDLPPALVVELGRAPAGHKYVRVAADILMIAIGTGMVVDAIEDLGRM